MFYLRVFDVFLYCLVHVTTFKDENPKYNYKPFNDLYCFIYEKEVYMYITRQLHDVLLYIILSVDNVLMWFPF